MCSSDLILLTALSEEANIVQGLDMGADDYVAKPYRVKELLARIGALIRRRTQYDAGDEEGIRERKKFCFGTHCFFIQEFRLYCGSKMVECTTSELRLLKELISNEGLVLTRDQLMQRLFDKDNTFVDDNTLSVYLKRLRDKLGEDASYIETVRGVGYRFRRG